MNTEKEVYCSDTLERSNLSSLQSDLTSEKKSSEISTANLQKVHNCLCRQYNLDNIQFIPCPVLNSKFDPTEYSGRCFCQRQISKSGFQKENNGDKNEWQRFNWKWPRQNFVNKKDKSYEVKLKSKRHLKVEKPFACCEMVDEVAQKKSSGFRNSIENPVKHNQNSKDEKDIAEKIEIYYFDHGNSAYYHTTDIPPILKTEKLAEKSSSAAIKFWAEIFGYAHIAVSLITAGVLQLFRCLLFSLVRPLTVGIIQLVGDYFIKPLLTIIFNGLIQPVLIMLYNIATSFRDCCEPIATALGFFMKEIAMLFRSCRLVEINHYHNMTDASS